MSEADPQVLQFERARVEAILARLEQMAGGDTKVQLPISPNHDELDAIAHAVNVLADELRWASDRMAEAERTRMAELLSPKEPRTSR